MSLSPTPPEPASNPAGVTNDEVTLNFKYGNKFKTTIRKTRLNMKTQSVQIVIDPTGPITFNQEQFMKWASITMCTINPDYIFD